MKILYVITWIYLSGVGVTLLFWLLSFGIRLLTVLSLIKWEDFKYFLKIIALTVPLSWFGLHLGIKAIKVMNREKKKFNEKANSHGYLTENNFIKN